MAFIITLNDLFALSFLWQLGQDLRIKTHFNSSLEMEIIIFLSKILIWSILS